MDERWDCTTRSWPFVAGPEDLPVVIIQDVKELTQENLQRWYRWFNDPKNLRRYAWEKVTAFWWLQKIIDDTQLAYERQYLNLLITVGTSRTLKEARTLSP